MKRLGIVGTVILGFCISPAEAQEKIGEPTNTGGYVAETTERGSDRDADNTGRNVRDRDGRTATPPDQGTAKEERKLAASIRNELVKNAELSTYAKNIKIIVEDGEVFLRGPVRNSAEVAVVEQTARKHAGAQQVVNQLEVVR